MPDTCVRNLCAGATIPMLWHTNDFLTNPWDTERRWTISRGAKGFWGFFRPVLSRKTEDSPGEIPRHGAPDG
ncbi:hypothetical protein GCM10027073_23050 [Streptomyces chlorus]